MKLKSEQKRLYESLPQDARCFVRVCDTDDALWISDLPRRMANVQQWENMLCNQGFACRLDTQTRLWYVDWTEERWEQMLVSYPDTLPEFPAEEKYHAAYALCRLWLLHPSARTPENLPMVRRMLKLTAEPEGKLLAAIAPLHAQAARCLRDGIPMAYDAGRILAGWLNERRIEE